MMTMSSMMLMFADGDDADADDADEMYALILLFIVGRAMHLQ